MGRKEQKGKKRVVMVPKTTTANEKSPDRAGLLLRIYAIDCLVILSTQSLPFMW